MARRPQRPPVPPGAEDHTAAPQERCDSSQLCAGEKCEAVCRGKLDLQHVFFNKLRRLIDLFNAVCGAESVEMLHTAHRLTQKLLSRELADGRFRLLLACIRDDAGDGQHEVNALSEKARLRSSAGRGAGKRPQSLPITPYPDSVVSSAHPCIANYVVVTHPP